MKTANDYTAFLKRLAAYRTGLQITQAQLATQLGITQAKYSKFERGELMITNETLRQLMHMGWDMDYIVNDVTYPSTVPDIHALCHAAIGSKRSRVSSEDNILRILVPMLTELKTQTIYSGGVNAELQLLSLRLSSPQAQTLLLLCRHMLRQSQEQLAEKLGLGIKTYRVYERGRPLSADLALALGLLSECRASLFLFPEKVEWSIVRYVWSLLDENIRQSMQAVIETYGVFLQVIHQEDTLS